MADFQTNFQCKSGQMVSIAVHDFGPRVTVSDSDNRAKGAI